MEGLKFAVGRFNVYLYADGGGVDADGRCLFFTLDFFILKSTVRWENVRARNDFAGNVVVVVRQ